MKKYVSLISFFIWFFSTLVFFKDWSPYFLVIPILLMLSDIILNLKKKNYIEYEYVLIHHIFMFITIYYILINFFETNFIYIFYLSSIILITVYIEFEQLRRFRSSSKIIFFSYLMSVLFLLFFLWQKEQMPVLAFVPENEAVINSYKNYLISLLILSSLPLILKTVYLYFKNRTTNLKKMKKTILLALIGMLFSSCSSDSDGNLTVKYENMLGTWNIKELIKTDDTHVNYVNQCGESKDYIEFLVPREMKFYIYYGDTCTLSDLQEHCDNFIVNPETNTIQQCNEFLNGHVSKLTEHEMQIDFNTPRNFFYNDVYAKGMVLTR